MRACMPSATGGRARLQHLLRQLSIAMQIEMKLHMRTDACDMPLLVCRIQRWQTS